MENGSSMDEEEKERRLISSRPEFAEIYIFLQIFGPLMKLSEINLKYLEDFFINDNGIQVDLCMCTVVQIMFTPSKLIVEDVCVTTLSIKLNSL